MEANTWIESGLKIDPLAEQINYSQMRLRADPYIAFLSERLAPAYYASNNSGAETWLTLAQIYAGFRLWYQDREPRSPIPDLRHFDTVMSQKDYLGPRCRGDRWLAIQFK